MLSSVSISTVSEIRPSTIDQLKRLGLLTVGAVICVPPSELATRLQISLAEASHVVDTCDRMCHRGEIKVQSLADLCKSISKTALPRKTQCKPIDSVLDGGFRHGSVSEVFGLPGTGKTQLAMQLAAAATMPQFFGGLHHVAPVLVIDTEGSWTVERVTQFCTEFGLMMKETKQKFDEQQQKLKQEHQQEQLHQQPQVVQAEDDETSIAIHEFRPEVAAARIQFVRAADVTTVAAALYLFRENCNRAANVAATESMMLMSQQQQQQQSQRHQRNPTTSLSSPLDEENGVETSNNNNTTAVPVAEFTGGLVIIDSIAALFKENRIGGDFDGADNNHSNNNSISKSSGAQSLTKNQSIAALSRLLTSVAEETKSAVVVTNQMKSRNTHLLLQNQQQLQAFGDSNTAAARRFVPALGDSWANVPMCRIELKRIAGLPNTSQSRRCVVVRHWEWSGEVPSTTVTKNSNSNSSRAQSPSSSTSNAGNNNNPLFDAAASVGGSELLLPRRETIFRIGTLLTMPSVDDDAPPPPQVVPVYTMLSANPNQQQQNQQHQQFTVKSEPVRRARRLQDDDEGDESENGQDGNGRITTTGNNNNSNMEPPRPPNTASKPPQIQMANQQQVLNNNQRQAPPTPIHNNSNGGNSNKLVVNNKPTRTLFAIHQEQLRNRTADLSAASSALPSGAVSPQPVYDVPPPFLTGGQQHQQQEHQNQQQQPAPRPPTMAASIDAQQQQELQVVPAVQMQRINSKKSNKSGNDSDADDNSGAEINIFASARTRTQLPRTQR